MPVSFFSPSHSDNHTAPARDEVISLLEQALPIDDALSLTRMPDAWVRASFLLRIRSLLGGYSAVRPVIVSSLATLPKENVIPLIPLRGSVSASGDLMPLAYTGGVILGKKESRVWIRSKRDCRVASADVALAEIGLKAITL